jgi:predicted NBD/HSP70 family sugar kinase
MSPAVELPVVPKLEPEHLPAKFWNLAYRELVAQDRGAREFAIALQRSDGSSFVHRDRVLSANHPAAELSAIYVERILKFLLWQKGGSRILVAGAPELAATLRTHYAPDGPRAFDHQFFGERVFGEPLSITTCHYSELPAECDAAAAVGTGEDLSGCRIGFDLGGSDRKAAALIDGRVVFSEEIPWDPYFQSDPQYHLDGVRDSLRRAAAHLPRVDAIGGSAAGIYVNSEARVSSLFRGVPPAQFERHIRRMFRTLQREWGGIPFEVYNDGEVTALAGARALRSEAVLGLSFGTSQAAGYVTRAGGLTSWLNELAFAPVDYRSDGPRDEWSGDVGCGVQYFSQQGVARLAQRAGLTFANGMPNAEKLASIQTLMDQGDPRAREIFSTLGVCLGYALAHYAEHYDIRHVLFLGRVTSGGGGDELLGSAKKLLRQVFPALADQLVFSLPDEKTKRHGQAIAAASLPRLSQVSPSAS